MAQDGIDFLVRRPSGLLMEWSRSLTLFLSSKRKGDATLKRFFGSIRGGSHRFLGLLQDLLAPLTVTALVVVVIVSILFWDSWRGEESGGTAIRNLVLVLAAIIGLPLAIWRSKVAEHQAETAQRGLLNERYQKGAEMLGSDLSAVRIGGIYALARLAGEHPGDYHLQIMSLLCAFLHHHPAVEKENQNPEEKFREDFWIIIQVIVARSAAQIEIEKAEKYRLDLRELNLTNAKLTNADLTNADLMWADLSGAWLGEANLANADLFGACLSGAHLKDCKGFTQEQINQTNVHNGKLPNLESVVDAKTGKPIV